jgi:hypothetical protein
MLDKERIFNEVLQTIEEQLTEEELECIEIMEDIFYSNKSWDFVVNTYLDKVVEFTLYLIECEKDEKYEICQFTKDAIDILTNDMLRVGINYFDIDETQQEDIIGTPKLFFNNLYSVVMESDEYEKWRNNIIIDDYDDDDDDEY